MDIEELQKQQESYNRLADEFFTKAYKAQNEEYRDTCTRIAYEFLGSSRAYKRIIEEYKKCDVNKQPTTKQEKIKHIKNLLLGAFVWEDSNKGHEYWMSVINSLREESER